jgi:hypothetical protein
MWWDGNKEIVVVVPVVVPVARKVEVAPRLFGGGVSSLNI